MAAVRGLIVILAADMAGYASLVGADEEGTLERLKEHRQELVIPKLRSIAVVSSGQPAAVCSSSSPARLKRCSAPSICKGA